jgi:hypothetical protein
MVRFSGPGHNNFARENSVAGLPEFPCGILQVGEHCTPRPFPLKRRNTRYVQVL